MCALLRATPARQQVGVLSASSTADGVELGGGGGRGIWLLVVLVIALFESFNGFKSRRKRRPIGRKSAHCKVHCAATCCGRLARLPPPSRLSPLPRRTWGRPGPAGR